MSHFPCPHCGETVNLHDSEALIVPPGAVLDASDTSIDDGEMPTVTPSSPVCPSCGKTIDVTIEAEPATTLDARPNLDRDAIAQFELLEELGQGGFGTVYRARDTQLDRIVALKIPRDERLNPNDAELFLREARAAAQLKHPGIVAVHEVGRVDGRVYIVSDFIDGVPLNEWLSARELSIRDAAGLCHGIAEALHHAHEKGVVHRDLKPGNIMMDAAGKPHVMDFGLARRESDDVTITAAGQVMGTPAYMSPEQAAGHAHTADRRTDVYSLGVILYELITGERPFRGSVRMLILQIQNDEPPSPRKLNGSVPKDLETIVLKCLEKSPGNRYATTKELADELQRFLSDRPILARPISRPTRIYRWCKRNRLATGLVGSVMLLLLTLAIAVPWIVAERAERRQQEALAAAEKDRELQERRARVKERMAAADVALQSNDVRQALRHYSEVVGLAGDREGLARERESASQKRQQLLKYGRFLEAERAVAAWLDPTDPNLLRGPIDRPRDVIRRELRLKTKRALDLLGILDDSEWKSTIDALPISPSQKQEVLKKVNSLSWMLAFGCNFAESEEQPSLASLGLTALDRVAAIEGHSHAGWMFRMWFLDRLKRRIESERARNQMKKAGIVTTLDLYMRGFIDLRLGRPKKALVYFLTVLKRDPGHYSAHYSLFECHKALRDAEGQIRELTACLAVTPKDAHMFLVRGLMYFTTARGKHLPMVMAYQDFDAAVKLDPRNTAAWFYRARMQIYMNKWAEAETSLTQTLKLDDKYIGGKYYRAICRAKQGNHATAAVDAEDAIKLRPNNGSTCFYTARAYAICAGVTKQTDTQLSKKYADRSVELLNRAIKLKYRPGTRIGPGSDFDPVRDHPDFPKVDVPEKI